MLGWDRRGHNYIAWKELLQGVTGHGETIFTVLWALVQLKELPYFVCLWGGFVCLFFWVLFCFFFVCCHKAGIVQRGFPLKSPQLLSYQQ